MAVWVFTGLGILLPGESDWKALGIAFALFTLLPCAVMVLLRKRGLEDVYDPEPLLRQRILLMERPATWQVSSLFRRWMRGRK